MNTYHTGIRISIIVIVGLCIIAGLVAAGSPKQARIYRLDNDRITDLQSVEQSVRDYASQYHTLPTTTADLVHYQKTMQWYPGPIMTDPETNELYVYQKTGDDTFTLCATFRASSINRSKAGQSSYGYTGPYGVSTWDHEAGYHCFERTIPKEGFHTIQ